MAEAVLNIVVLTLRCSCSVQQRQAVVPDRRCPRLNLARIVEACHRSAQPTAQPLPIWWAMAMAAGLLLLVRGAGGWGLREQV